MELICICALSKDAVRRVRVGLGEENHKPSSIFVLSDDRAVRLSHAWSSPGELHNVFN